MKNTEKQPSTMVITQLEEAPVPAEVLATAIVAMAEGMKKLRAGRLNDRAIILLVQNSMGYSKASLSTIKQVLDSIENLEKTYCKPRKTK